MGRELVTSGVCAPVTRTLDPDHPAEGVPSVASILARWAGPREYLFVPSPARGHERSVLAAPTAVTLTVVEDRSWPPLFGAMGPDTLSIPVVVTMHADAGWSGSVFGTVVRDASGSESLGPWCNQAGVLPPTLVSPALVRTLRLEDPNWERLVVHHPTLGDDVVVISVVAGPDRWTVHGSWRALAAVP